MAVRGRGPARREPRARGHEGELATAGQRRWLAQLGEELGRRVPRGLSRREAEALIGRWRQDLTRAQRREFRAALAEVKEEQGLASFRDPAAGTRRDLRVGRAAGPSRNDRPSAVRRDARRSVWRWLMAGRADAVPRRSSRSSRPRERSARRSPVLARGRGRSAGRGGSLLGGGRRVGAARVVGSKGSPLSGKRIGGKKIR